MADAKRQLVECIESFGGDALRDIWLFDPSRYEALYIREDVKANIDNIEVNDFVDNERFGYITRDTYNALSHATYQYSVHGFDEFEQFRAFLGSNTTDPGVFISFDCDTDGYNFAKLYGTLMDFSATTDSSRLTPENSGRWAGD
ncbi:MULTISPECIES: hypothetical protein [unclassified Haladaptatus]|uniref:DUF7522 family protein n=1 Tax=unclassified Haladaptatus TaxID=2622732 RepID=UPI0023E8CB02|nr:MULTISPECIES: hypothetical protein [unclassified Haladaptatus]